MLFTDGGFDYTNNPTLKGFQEINEDWDTENIGVIISIGTARRDEQPKKSIFSKARGWIARGADPEHIHRQMLIQQHLQKHCEDLSYYRFNNPGSLAISLDD